VFFRQQEPLPDDPADMRMDMADGRYILFRRTSPYYANEGMRFLVPVEEGTPDGYRKWFDYSDKSEYPYRVRDSFGRQMQLTWTVADLADGTSEGNAPIKVISEILLPDATRLVYTYGYATGTTIIGRKDRLQTVQRLDSAGTAIWGRTYLYEDGRFPYALTGILDQNGARLSTYSYAASGLVASSEAAGGHKAAHVQVFRRRIDGRLCLQEGCQSAGAGNDLHIFPAGCLLHSHDAPGADAG
jgi:hypothetical protein